MAREVGFDIDVKIIDLENVYQSFDAKRARRVIARGLTDTARQARRRKGGRDAGQLIAEDTGIRPTEVRKHLYVRRAFENHLQSALVAQGKPPTLYKSATGVRQTKKGVSVRIGNRRKLFPGAFVQTMPVSGHKGIWRRSPASEKSTGYDRRGRPRRNRLPIYELWGPSIPEAMIREHVNAALHQIIHERLPLNFERQIDREKRKLAGLVEG